MSGFKLQLLTGDADRISVSSDRKPSFVPIRRKFKVLPPKWTEVAIERDEVTILKSRGDAEIRLEASKDDRFGRLIIRSSRKGVRVLGPCQRIVWELEDGEVLSLRTEQAQDPVRGHTVGVGPT